MAINAPPQTITMKGLSRNGKFRRGPRDRTKETASRDRGSRSCLFRAFVKLASLGLPVSGNALRHTFRSIAVSLEIRRSDFVLMGHSLQGVSARYTKRVDDRELASSSRGAEKISRRIFELLGLTLGHHGCAARAGHADPSRTEPEKELRSGPHRLRRGEAKAKDVISWGECQNF